MTLQEKSQKIAELEAQKKAIDQVLKPLKEEVYEEMLQIGTKKLEFDFGKVTIVASHRPQVIDEKKVIAYLKKLKLDKEYVEPRLKDIFNVKAFVEEQGMVDGIVVNTSEYVLVTPAKEEVSA
jgi:polyribonucleotide nucleotidyltransferase